MVLILLADWFEELEALSPLDILIRSGHIVKTVGVTGRDVRGTHGVTVLADLTPEEVELDDVELAIFPGGLPGAYNLNDSEFTDRVIEAVLKNGGRLAAICAAPIVLGSRGLLDGKRATCFPGFENELGDAIYTGEGVVTDGNITTAKSYAESFAFGTELARLLEADRAGY